MAPTFTCGLRFFGNVTDGSNVAAASDAADSASMDVYVKSVLRNAAPGSDGRPITGAPATVSAPPAASVPNHVPPPHATVSAPGADAVPVTTPPFSSSVVMPDSVALSNACVATPLTTSVPEPVMVPEKTPFVGMALISAVAPLTSSSVPAPESVPNFSYAAAIASVAPESMVTGDSSPIEFRAAVALRSG